MSTVETVTCGKCDGHKTLSWTRIANGVCFACGGAGILSVDVTELAAVCMPRSACIAQIARILDMPADRMADEDSTLGRLLAHADTDVRARALAAFEARYPYANLGVALHNAARAEQDERAALAAKVRKVTKNVRKVA